jgi:hypothetical protein
MYWYDGQLLEGEPGFQQIFHEVWKTAFTPSGPVRKVIESEMEKMGLTPGAYTAAHLRVLYGMKDRKEWIKETWAQNAMNCASELRPAKAIFFTSDSANATYHAKVHAARHNATIATRVPNPNPPLHLDRVDSWNQRPLSDFYDAFVDLYILAQADCVTYNKGGYGILGLYMNRNASCGLRQDAMNRPIIHKPCSWVDDTLNGTESTRHHYQPSDVVIRHSLYLEPMQD